MESFLCSDCGQGETFWFPFFDKLVLLGFIDSLARFQPKLDAPYALFRDTGKRNRCPTRVWCETSKLQGLFPTIAARYGPGQGCLCCIRQLDAASAAPRIDRTEHAIRDKLDELLDQPRHEGHSKLLCVSRSRQRLFKLLTLGLQRVANDLLLRAIHSHACCP